MIHVSAKRRAARARFARVAHMIAYLMWVALLAARVALLVAALGLLTFDMVITRAHAQTGAGNAREVQEILTNRPLNRVIDGRRLCLTGVRGQSVVALDKAFASNITAGLADECVAYLVRLGRDGRLDYLANSNGSPPNSPLSFDEGFVVAYRKAERIPAELPTVATLRPYAVRCLTQAEPDTKLCNAVGYAYGARAALGETVVNY